MEIKNVLFDLDGTLLPMDMERFTNGYFQLLTEKMAPLGYDPKALIDTVWAGTAAMVKNDGSRLNEEAFWAKFAQAFGPEALADQPVFEAFYANEFQRARQFCGYDPLAAQAVEAVKASGRRVVLATNPIFPAAATRSRLSWAGLKPADFELVTTYENSRFCKPSVGYYRDILDRLGLRGEDCLMVGNDMTEDTAAAEAGMGVFLITSCLINKEGKDVNAWPHGGFDDLIRFVCG